LRNGYLKLMKWLERCGTQRDVGKGHATSLAEDVAGRETQRLLQKTWLEVERNVSCRRRCWKGDATSLAEDVAGKRRRNVSCRRRCWKGDGTSLTEDVAGRETQRFLQKTLLERGDVAGKEVLPYFRMPSVFEFTLENLLMKILQ
jgi:hypothetical protein